MLQDLGRSREPFNNESQLIVPASMLADYTVQDVQAFLSQIYSFGSQLPRHVAEAHQLIGLADRFDAAKLIKCCVDHFCAQPDSLFKAITQADGALKWTLLAERYELDEILKRSLKFIASNFCMLR